MKERIIKGVLYNENHVVMEWQEPHAADPSGTIEAIKHIKESINSYLTQLVNENKVCNVKDKKEFCEDVEEEEEEQEEIQEDKISGLIKGMVAVDEKGLRKKKRRIK